MDALAEFFPGIRKDRWEIPLSLVPGVIVLLDHPQKNKCLRHLCTNNIKKFRDHACAQRTALLLLLKQ